MRQLFLQIELDIVAQNAISHFEIWGFSNFNCMSFKKIKHLIQLSLQTCVHFVHNTPFVTKGLQLAL